ncbi:alpha/beta hydrolase [Curtobacterium luteum]|uniref:alpha/beta hydrolase n=1 Tax=Curtobacterium luteum TaxID=33881 RepID=UPI0037FFF039
MGGAPRCGADGAGHAFFDRRPDGSFDDDDVAARVAPLVDAIDHGQRMIGRTEHTVVLGFSNGAVMAAALIEQHPELFTGGVLLRPKPPFRSTPAPSGLTLPVLVVDGRNDRRRTPEDGARTAERLRQGGADVEHVVLDIGHGITEDDERAVLDWLGRTSGRVRNAFPDEGPDAYDR